MQNLNVPNFVLKGFLASVFSFAFLDLWFYNLFSARTPEIRAIWAEITYLGDSEWMLIGALALGGISFGIYRLKFRQHRLSNEKNGWWVWKRRYHLAVFVFSSVALTGIFSSLAKNSIGRARPYLIEEVGHRGFNPLAFQSEWAAWPSGHTTTAFAMATALTLIVPKFRIVFFAIAAIAGFSRGALGAHYLSDIIMGATVGIAGTVLIYHWQSKKLLIRSFPRYPRNTQATESDESDIEA